MKILLWCDDLLSRTRMETAWKAAGATLLSRDAADAAELIVVDLTARNSLDVIQRLRSAYPAVPIVAFGPHVDGDAFRAARSRGATKTVARGAVVDRVLRRLAPTA